MTSITLSAHDGPRAHVEILARLMPDNRLFAVMLRHGRDFAPGPMPKGARRGRLGHCWANASRLAVRRGLRYAEGWAIKPDCGIPMAHGWAVDAEGLAVDPTWRDDGVRWFGVALTDDELYLLMEKARQWGGFMDWHGRLFVEVLEARE